MRFTKSKADQATPIVSLEEIERREREIEEEAASLAERRTQIRTAEDQELASQEAALDQRRKDLAAARMTAEQRAEIQRETERRDRVAAVSETAKLERLKLAGEVASAEERETAALQAFEHANADREGLFARQRQQHIAAARALGQAGATAEEISELLGRPPEVSGARIVRGRAEFGFYENALHQTLTHDRITDADRPRSRVVIIMERRDR